MNTRLHLLAFALLGAYPAQAGPPFILAQTIEMPEVPAGPYADHMALDLQGRRLFTTPQANKAVDVLDLATGRVLRTIPGFGNPHAILFRGDRNRLFVTDGDGALDILDATSFSRIKSIELQRDADGIGYDAKTGYLYVSNGGAAAGNDYSLISIIDTAREAKIGDIRVGSPGLEAMVIDNASGRLYVNLPEQNAIAVINLETRTVIATWTLTMGNRNEAFALDEAHHWLYVGCNDSDVRGSIVVIDTRTGKEQRRLPIGSWVDSMFYDAPRRRVYASTGVGEVFTYERQSDGGYRALEPVDTAVMARTALFSAELDLLFVTVPHLGWTTAKVLVFKPQSSR
jgi:DNA-binding beta-propeller fold protein YncE